MLPLSLLVLDVVLLQLDVVVDEFLVGDGVVVGKDGVPLLKKGIYFWKPPLCIVEGIKFSNIIMTFLIKD